MFSTLYRYITKYLAINYLIGIAIVSIIIISIETRNVIILYIEFSADLYDTIMTIIYFTLYVLDSTLLYGLSISYSLTISNFSANNEILALNSSGISNKRIALILIAFSLKVSVILYINKEYIYSIAHNKYITTKIKLYTSNPSSKIAKDNKIVINNFLVVIENMNLNNNELINVRITNLKTLEIIIAKRGIIMKKLKDQHFIPFLLINPKIYQGNSLLSSNNISDSTKNMITTYSNYTIIYLPSLDKWGFRDSYNNKSISYLINYFNLKSKSTIDVLLDKLNSNFIVNSMKIMKLENNKELNNKSLLIEIEKELKKIKLQHSDFHKYNSHIGRLNYYDDSSILFYINNKISAIVTTFIFILIILPMSLFHSRSNKISSINISAFTIMLHLALDKISFIILKLYQFNSFLLAWLPNIGLTILGIIIILYKKSRK